jgi:HSP20 family protein
VTTPLYNGGDAVAPYAAGVGKGLRMSEFRKRFWDTFEQMQEEFDLFFEHYARAKRPALVGYRAHWSPPANVCESADALHVLVEIAGMSRDGLELSLEPGRLTLRGARVAPEATARGCFHQMEISFGEFELNIPLSVAVDGATAQAWYRDGFLHVALAKMAEPAACRIMLSISPC